MDLRSLQGAGYSACSDCSRNPAARFGVAWRVVRLRDLRRGGKRRSGGRERYGHTIFERGVDSHLPRVTGLAMRLFRSQARSLRLPEPLLCAGRARPRSSSPLGAAVSRIARQDWLQAVDMHTISAPAGIFASDLLAQRSAQLREEAVGAAGMRDGGNGGPWSLAVVPSRSRGLPISGIRWRQDRSTSNCRFRPNQSEARRRPSGTRIWPARPRRSAAPRPLGPQNARDGRPHPSQPAGNRQPLRLGRRPLRQMQHHPPRRGLHPRRDLEYPPALTSPELPPGSP